MLLERNKIRKLKATIKVEILRRLLKIIQQQELIINLGTNWTFEECARKGVNIKWKLRSGILRKASSLNKILNKYSKNKKHI